METVEHYMGLLTQAVENSTTYRDYLEQKEIVLRNPGLREKINEYRGRNYALQHTEGVDLFYELDKLEKEYKEFLQQETVAKYLETELAVCRLMQRISAQLAGSIDLDLDSVVL